MGTGFYEAFRQTFITDDHFLSMVGAVSSVFNCSGRLFYGVFMDRFSYKYVTNNQKKNFRIYNLTYFFFRFPEPL